MNRMIPPPRWLPSANSRKWHNRRWWDSLGYLRARTLSNEAWERDTVWLMRLMTHHRPGEPGEHRDTYDSAAQSLRTYHDNPKDERLWDAYLTDLDAYLWLVQRDHFDAVAEAGASGPRALRASERKAR